MGTEPVQEQPTAVVERKRRVRIALHIDLELVGDAILLTDAELPEIVARLLPSVCEPILNTVDAMVEIVGADLDRVEAA